MAGMPMGKERVKIRRVTELQVYRQGMEAAMLVMEMSKEFPSAERYSLSDQVRRSSRSVCANLAEAWGKRIYRAAFISKINDAEAEAFETQTWIEISVRCGYLDRDAALELYTSYDEIISMLVAMRVRPEKWLIT